MSQTSKTLRRLCLATGVVTVAGVFPALAAVPAFASAPVTGASSLSVSPTTTGSFSTSNTTFTTTSATNATATVNTIAVQSQDTSGAPITFTGETTKNFTVTYGSAGTTDTVSGAAVSTTATTGDTVTLTLTDPIPAGTSVTVKNAPVTTISGSSGTTKGELNPASTSTDFFAVSTSGDTTAQDTNTVQIGTAATQPTVTQVNPNALNSAGGTPFTITGSNFSTSSNTSSTTYATTVDYFLTTNTTSTPDATSAGTPVSSTQVRTTNPALVPGSSYDVVVTQASTDVATSAVTTTGTTSRTAADQVTAVANLGVVPESGIRVADSRTGFNIPAGPVSSAGTESVPLSAFAAQANIPSDANALVMNVTAIGANGAGGPAGPGNLQVYSGATAPGTATVNFTPGVATGNLTTVTLPSTNAVVTGGAAYTNSGDSLTILDQGAPADFTFDVVGYTTNTGTYTGAGGTGTFANGINSFTPTNTRILDTRSGQTDQAANTTQLTGPLVGYHAYSIQVPGVTTAGVPVALNVAAVAPTSVGNINVYPEPASGPGSDPNTAVTQFVPGTDTSTYLITQTGNGGKVDLYAETPGTFNAVIDLTGEFASSGASGLNTTNPPSRAYDSRTSGGIGSEGTATVGINNPGTPAVAAIVEVSSINPTAVGNTRTYPAGTSAPNTATINYYPNHTRENLAVVALKNGQLTLLNDSTGMDNATIDVVGYIN